MADRVCGSVRLCKLCNGHEPQNLEAASWKCGFCRMTGLCHDCVSQSKCCQGNDPQFDGESSTREEILNREVETMRKEIASLREENQRMKDHLEKIRLYAIGSGSAIKVLLERP